MIVCVLGGESDTTGFGLVSYARQTYFETRKNPTNDVKTTPHKFRQQERNNKILCSALVRRARIGHDMPRQIGGN